MKGNKLYIVFKIICLNVVTPAASGHCRDNQLLDESRRRGRGGAVSMGGGMK